MEIKFQKMHGTRNDFVVFHDQTNSVKLSAEQVMLLCDRRIGIGADGVIIVRPDESADFFMDYMNSDGSVAEMCGNGIRCLAKYAYDNGLTKDTSIRVRTRAGLKVLELFPDSAGKIVTVRVDMGRPIFDPRLIPVDIHTETVPIVDYRIEVQGRRFPATFISMGNPHCVIFVQDPPEALPALYGPIIEQLAIFPAKTNVEFVRVLDRTHILMRVWERGSGETFACGTGACAAAVAAGMKDMIDSKATVHLKGGDLLIEWQTHTSSVLMTGSADLVYRGTINI